MSPQPTPSLSAPSGLVDGVMALFESMERYAKTGVVPPGLEGSHTVFSRASGVPLQPPIVRLRRPSFYRWWHACKSKSPATRAFFELHDQSLLGWCHRVGAFEVLPTHRDVNETYGGAFFSGSLGQPGEVEIASRLDGAFPLGRVSNATLSRWFVLLHETAHQEFSLTPSPFRPSPGRSVDLALIDLVNDWCVGTMGSQSPVEAILNECFADAYAALLLYRCLPQTIHRAITEQLAHIQRYRQANQDEAEEGLIKSWIEDGLEGKLRLEESHVTAGVLEQVQRRRSDWEHLAVADLKGLALEMASDAVMALCQFDKASKQGMPLGTYYRFCFIPALPEEHLVVALDGVGLAYLWGANMQVALADLGQTTAPLMALIREAMPGFLKDLEARFPAARQEVLEGKEGRVIWLQLHWFSRKWVKQNARAVQGFEAFEFAARSAAQTLVADLVEKPLKHAGLWQQYPALQVALGEQRKRLKLLPEQPSASAECP